MSRRRWLGAIAVSTLLSAGMLLGISAAPAMASPNICWDDVCANVAAETYSQIFIHVWAYNQNFTGHFEVQTPEHTYANSKDKLNIGGGSGPTFAFPMDGCYPRSPRTGSCRAGRGTACRLLGRSSSAKLTQLRAAG